MHLYESVTQCGRGGPLEENDGPLGATVSEQEGTTFVQWRERAQNEITEERPQMRVLLIVAAAVVILGIVAGTVTLMMS